MTDQEQRAVVVLCLQAAFADGSKADAERAEVKRIAEGFPEAAVDLPRLYQDVLMKRVSPAETARDLGTPEARQLAYEMALCICEADGRTNEAERDFLADLRRALGLPDEAVSTVEQAADRLAEAPLAGEVTMAAPAGPPAGDTTPDSVILQHAILAGALELLPSSLATMAIIPLQMRLVYRIGREHGVELDRGHVREFLATVGVGLTSQVLEGHVSRILRGVMGAVLGKAGKALAGQATSSAFSFATTYALGQVAKRYYAGGRRLDTAQLRETFQAMLGEARALQTRYLPEIQQRSRSLDLPGVLSSLSR